MTQAAQLAQYGANNVGLSFKNRLINGDMVISQRNGTSSITPTATSFPWTYNVDRWLTVQSQASKFSVQQNQGSVTPPAGFTNYLGITSLAATSLGASDVYLLQQRIEGFNIADLGWGTANAQPVTLSFWTRSSLTGAFGGSFTNNADNRSYAFSYTINAANTWEYKTITVLGDTTGAWEATSAAGILVSFSLGVGSTNTGAGGSWVAGLRLTPTGSVSIVGTNGATFQITGVQLEKGTVATSFDYFPFGTELMLCQRYFTRTYGYSGLTGSGSELSGTVYGSVQMRTTPTLTATIQEGGPSALDGLNSQNANSNMICRWWVGSGSKGSPGYVVWNGTASAEL